MNKQAEDIRVIREMMEKSTQFLSLSGLSGIFAGLTAIAGAAFAYFYLLRDPSLTDYNRMQENLILLADALLVYGMALINASKYTFEEINYLGITEVVPGLSATVFCITVFYFGQSGLDSVTFFTD